MGWHQHLEVLPIEKLWGLKDQIMYFKILAFLICSGL